ncbi:MAG: glutamate synthase-related protein [Acidimicrobiaceae bacterium]|nr:glutamate synthase-related protein [Acidimicrobiaceae bacterium]MCY4280029.1 glutamate synthase-related protein [Acidimicrobiaceae bacterium]MCY4295035.1 glutamate synthase-related protein [Acidimicrobiaceae bacterium]
MQPHKIATWSELPDRSPVGVLVADVDLVIVRFDDNHSVLYGRCLHRGALMSDGSVVGDNLVCGLHGWDYGFRTGVSSYDNSDRLTKFSSWLQGDDLMIDFEEVADFCKQHPQPFDRGAYQGAYADPHGDPSEPHVGLIRRLADEGLEYLGHHGPVASMGVPRSELPSWDDIQFAVAQLARRPLLDDEPVATDVVVGPDAGSPLRLEIPIFVSDMSFGALSEEAKVALARGAELSGTGICSGEGGMLPEERAENSRYFYELASGRFGWALHKAAGCRAFHFKLGQGAKTGTGGHLPGSKVQGKIAEVRGLAPGTAAISPSTFTDLCSVEDFRRVADEVREASGGIPIGVKLSAQHIEVDIDAALQIGVDYIILDGRGGGTGAAPVLFRDNISVPTIPALARARRHLDAQADRRVTLVITGGLRTPADFAKALALGADAVAVSNAAMQAIGCLGMRACSTNNCPVGIATQNPRLRARLPVDEAAERLHKFFCASVELMCVLARACGHRRLSEFNSDDLTTFDRETAHLTGIAYGGISL